VPEARNRRGNASGFRRRETAAALEPDRFVSGLDVLDRGIVSGMASSFTEQIFAQRSPAPESSPRKMPDVNECARMPSCQVAVKPS
jgi:hypothetical protein